MDNEFGHYECGDGDEIHCLEGWTGANCQTPVCDKNGCGVGGICVAPGRCECKPGWGGVNCEICLPRKGCKNGVCVEGGDCVCKPGFTHWLCDKAVVSFEEVNGAETTPSVVHTHSFFILHFSTCLFIFPLVKLNFHFRAIFLFS
ncbi:unnamed protein product [Hydatigera taeniaeformis]|uniref:EGF-like domain-containing protein n=1 Tax=Hydatigena taeniaeformis TaxID=6205 RepID=A0A3P7F674_HYDTA|nr:unnamed protein product [Hydatigera taeniaeformis]